MPHEKSLLSVNIKKKYYMYYTRVNCGTNNKQAAEVSAGNCRNSGLCSGDHWERSHAGTRVLCRAVTCNKCDTPLSTEINKQPRNIMESEESANALDGHGWVT